MADPSTPAPPESRCRPSARASSTRPVRTSCAAGTSATPASTRAAEASTSSTTPSAPALTPAPPSTHRATALPVSSACRRRSAGPVPRAASSTGSWSKTSSRSRRTRRAEQSPVARAPSATAPARHPPAFPSRASVARAVCTRPTTGAATRASRSAATSSTAEASVVRGAPSGKPARQRLCLRQPLSLRPRHARHRHLRCAHRQWRALSFAQLLRLLRFELVRADGPVCVA